MADTKALVRAKTLKRKDTDMLGSNPNLLHQEVARLCQKWAVTDRC